MSDMNIASFNIAKVTDILTENGEYSTQKEKFETDLVNKSNFIYWLANLFNEYTSTYKDCYKLNYIKEKCSYLRIGNPFTILESGKFQVNMNEPWENEKCGLMLEFKDNLVSGIKFYYYFLTTENLFNYEKKCSRFNHNSIIES